MFKKKPFRRGDWIETDGNQILLAEMWGDYIDWEKRRKGENSWLVKQLKRFNCQKIFDSALGDGCDSIYLIKEGFDVISNDIDEIFIKKALENAKKYNVRLKIIELDWRDLTKKIPEQSFDATLCLGNSLTCLFDDENQIAALRQFFAILKGKGILIIDERNYQYLLDNREAILKGKFHPFSHKYLYCGKSIQSRPTELEDDKIRFEFYDERTNKKAYCVGYPFKRGELRQMLEEVGFRNIEQYSDYQLGYNPKADFYMYVCQR